MPKLTHITSLYSPKYPSNLVSILQTAKFNERRFVKKVWQTKDFSDKSLEKAELTRRSKVMLYVVKLGIILNIIGGIALVYLGMADKVIGGVAFGLALILIYPLLWSHLLALMSYFIKLSTNEEAL